LTFHFVHFYARTLVYTQHLKSPYFPCALYLCRRFPRPSASGHVVFEQGDFSRQNKTINKAVERFMPVPDSVLQTAAATVASTATADTSMLGASSSISGSGGATPYTDFMQIGGARKQVLGLNLDRVRLIRESRVSASSLCALSYSARTLSGGVRLLFAFAAQAEK
jgi:hypothetical protein